MIAVFDTNIVIDALNGVPEADEEYGRYDRVLISDVTWLEILSGADGDDTLLREPKAPCPLSESGFTCGGPSTRSCNDAMKSSTWLCFSGGKALNCFAISSTRVMGTSKFFADYKSDF